MTSSLDISPVESRNQTFSSMFGFFFVAQVNEMIDFIKSGKELNDWGARVSSCVEAGHGKALDQHQVSTSNVDTFQWKQNCTMYL